MYAFIYTYCMFKSLGKVYFYFSKLINTFLFSTLHLSKVTVWKIRYVSWEANQHIAMTSEGLYDTEDWSNDAEKYALSSKE